MGAPIPTPITPPRIFHLRETARLAAHDLGTAHATLTTTQESNAIGQASDGAVENAHRKVAEATAKLNAARAASLRAHRKWDGMRTAAHSVRGLAYDDGAGTYDGGDR